MNLACDIAAVFHARRWPAAKECVPVAAGPGAKADTLASPMDTRQADGSFMIDGVFGIIAH